MSETVSVPGGDNIAETATLLLAAAEEQGLDVHVVETADGGFRVPVEVAKAAGLAEPEPAEEAPKPVAKKVAAKKTAKKTAKKST